MSKFFEEFFAELGRSLAKLIGRALDRLLVELGWIEPVPSPTPAAEDVEASEWRDATIPTGQRIRGNEWVNGQPRSLCHACQKIRSNEAPSLFTRMRLAVRRALGAL